ncbi:MAG: endopeptidase La, partial [Gammaproteobacteria bacterium]|nr:endopeptidase La [Gammaproteobacteria bacterium]
MSDIEQIESQDSKETIPVLPLRDVVVYPHMVIPLFVGREKSIRALEEAMASDKEILLVAQKSASEDEPHLDEIFRIGTIANILQLLRLPDGTVKVLVEGKSRAQVLEFVTDEDYIAAKFSVPESIESDEKEAEVLSRSLVSQFERYVKVNKKIAPEVMNSLAGIEDQSRLVDTVAAHMSLKVDEKQSILETIDLQ